MPRFFVMLLIGLTAFDFESNVRIDGVNNENRFNIEDSTILWRSNLKLSWDDYESSPDSTSQYQANTSSWIRFLPIVYDDSIVLEIPCYFVKSQSWSKDKLAVELLRHEQLHFDIAELIARKIRKDCSKHISTSLKESSKILQSHYDKYYGTDWDNLNKSYDTETEHGTISVKQIEWESKIAKDLKALNAYSSTRLVIKRVK